MTNTKLTKFIAAGVIAILMAPAWGHSAPLSGSDKLQVMLALMNDAKTPQDLKWLLQWMIGPQPEDPPIRVSEFECEDSRFRKSDGAFYCLLRTQEKNERPGLRGRILIEGHREKTGFVIDTLRVL